MKPKYTWPRGERPALTCNHRAMSDASDARAKRRALELLATLASDLTPEGMGYAVCLFDLGPGTILTSRSNAAPRDEFIRTLQEWIAAEERKQEFQSP